MSLINSYLKNNIKTLLDGTTFISYPLLYTDEMIKNQEIPLAFVGNSLVENPLKYKLIVGSYPSLDKDPVTIKSVTKHYYLLILEKWIYKELKSLLNYIKIVNGKPKLIDSMDEYKDTIDEDDMETMDKKIVYLEKIILTRKMVKHVLSKLVNENVDIHWYNLRNYNDRIKRVFYRYLKNKFDEAIDK